MNFFLADMSEDLKSITFEGDDFHHFKNVFRGKVGERGKVFNGDGLVASGEVTEVTKKNLTFHVENFEKYQRPRSLKLILGVPKKEYYESILKSCIQIGINEIFLIQTKFSPWKFKDHPRFQKIIESSVTQSENPFSPKVEEIKNLSEIENVAQKIIFFTTEIESNGERIEKFEGSEIGFFIGPEGGFHQSEIEQLSKLENLIPVKLPTPIMKAETAVVFAAGLLS